MDIEYSLTEADLVAFAEYQVKFSPRLKRALGRIRLGYIIGTVFIALGIWALGRGILLPAVIAGIGLVFSFLSPLIYTERLRRRYIRSYRDPANQSLQSRRTIRVQEDGLEISSEVSRTSVQWSAVSRVDESPTHVYLYLSSTDVVMIPKRAVEPERLRAFLAFIDDHRKKAASGQASA